MYSEPVCHGHIALRAMCLYQCLFVETSSRNKIVPLGTFPWASDLGHHTKCDVAIRLACLIHAASVHPEPGSNSQNRETIFRRIRFIEKQIERNPPSPPAQGRGERTNHKKL